MYLFGITLKYFSFRIDCLSRRINFINFDVILIQGVSPFIFPPLGVSLKAFLELVNFALISVDVATISGVMKLYCWRKVRGRRWNRPSALMSAHLKPSSVVRWASAC